MSLLPSSAPAVPVSGGATRPSLRRTHGTGTLTSSLSSASEKAMASVQQLAARELKAMFGFDEDGDIEQHMPATADLPCLPSEIPQYEEFFEKFPDAALSQQYAIAPGDAARYMARANEASRRTVQSASYAHRHLRSMWGNRFDHFRKEQLKQKYVDSALLGLDVADSKTVRANLFTRTNLSFSSCSTLWPTNLMAWSNNMTLTTKRTTTILAKTRVWPQRMHGATTARAMSVTCWSSGHSSDGPTTS
jgi:hypothetical protein